jgi:hypothetical protein
MNILVYILGIGLVVRTLLDLATLSRSNLVTDTLYTVLYGGLGVAILFDDLHSIYGYGAVVVAIGWAAHGIFRFRKKTVANT